MHLLLFPFEGRASSENAKDGFFKKKALSALSVDYKNEPTIGGTEPKSHYCMVHTATGALYVIYERHW